MELGIQADVEYEPYEGYCLVLSKERNPGMSTKVCLGGTPEEALRVLQQAIRMIRENHL